MTAEAVLFALLRTAVCGEVLSGETVAACTPEILSAVYSLAGKHDLAHLLSSSLEKTVFPSNEILTRFKAAKEQAIYRYMRLDFEYDNICRILEEAKIPYIPLKGAVLREAYPEPWMRTSTDIDILIHAADLERAVQLMERNLSYHRKGKSTHDVSLYSSAGTHLELHYDTIEATVSEASQEVLSGIWEKAVQRQPGSCRYGMPDELFYFYHMAHMAKHIRNGGCGVRSFLDIWIMNHRMSFDFKKREETLAEGKLLTFAKAAQMLSEIWFSGARMDADSQRLEHYILDGGTHGTTRNKVTVKNTGKTYPLSRIVIPYEDLKYYYPILETKRWLTPIFQVVRWFRLLRSVRNSLKAKNLKKQTPIAKVDSTARLMQYLDI